MATLDRRIAALEAVQVAGESGFTWIIRDIVSGDGSSRPIETAEVYGERIVRGHDETEEEFLARAKRRAIELKPERHLLPTIIVNASELAC